MDWSTLVPVAVGGIIGVGGGALAAFVTNRNTRKLDRTNRRAAAYIEILTAAHAVDRICRTFAASAKSAADSQAFSDAVPHAEIQRSRVFTKFGSREVSSLMDAVIARVAEMTPTSRGADAQREYEAVLSAVGALDARVSAEMAP